MVVSTPNPKRINRIECVKRKEDQVRSNVQYDVALKWCRDNNKGAHAFVRTHPECTLVKKTALDARLHGKVQNGNAHAHMFILTGLEEENLVDFLERSNLGRDGQDFKQISAKVKDILLARCAQNKRGGRLYVPFSASASRILRGGFPSQKWFTLFFARHHEKLDTRAELSVEHKRAAAASEETLDEHFDGMWGLRAELIQAGIMDPETFEIDLSRVL